jgi:hypothetical protein
MRRVTRARAIRGLLALAGVVLALPLAASPVGASGLIATRPSDCRAAFNPYLYTQAAAGVCAPTYATTGRTPLAGGGAAQHYTVAGMAVSILLPPSGFRPATATAAQLDELGFPPRPTNPGDLGQWQTQMSGWTGAAPAPGFLATSHATADSVTSLNWSGYVVVGGAGAFTHAEAFYTEPSFGGSVCATNSEVTWAGIGGWNSGNLAQDGTSHNVPGLANHQAWWEILPAFITAVNLTAHAGFTFDASTRRISGGFRFFLMDSQSGQTVAFDVSSSRYDGSSAEAIAERPTVNGSLTNLSNFGTLTVSSSRANGTGFDAFSPNGSRHGVHMVDSSGGDMADPSTISSPGAFTVAQHHCN